MAEEYIFNVPRSHVEGVLLKVYPKDSDRYFIAVQECGEFLQAYSKCAMLKNNPRTLTAEWKVARAHLVEELTHVLVCLGMVAVKEGITQEEINQEIKKKAINGVQYPFEVKKKHASMEDLLKGLENCMRERDLHYPDSEHTCATCAFSDSTDYTITCRPMIQEALFYLNQCKQYNESCKPSDANNEK